MQLTYIETNLLKETNVLIRLTMIHSTNDIQQFFSIKHEHANRVNRRIVAAPVIPCGISFLSLTLSNCSRDNLKFIKM
jgi:hypothetical protein